ncbi:MAG: hypothetical protein FVQ80_07575 [Planctomycetes bacterium]|nr:hypothetical protein [Planctomycetota bacterium]
MAKTRANWYKTRAICIKMSAFCKFSKVGLARLIDFLVVWGTYSQNENFLPTHFNIRKSHHEEREGHEEKIKNLIPQRR